jgi:YVTN family beta-propeller protein
LSLCIVLAMALPSKAWDVVHRAYVTNQDNTVSVIDTARNIVIATIPIPANGCSVPAVAPDGKHLYVGCLNALFVIEAASNSVVAVPKIAGFIGFINGISVTPDGAQAYVTAVIPLHFGAGSVEVLDTATNSLAGVRSAFDTLGPAVISPDGKSAYVRANVAPPDAPPDVSQAGVWVVDTATNTVAATVTLPGRAGESGPAAISPDGKHLYVAGNDFFNSVHFVSVIDTATNTVEATVPVAGFDLAVNPDGKHVYALDSSAVNVIETDTNTVVAKIHLAGGPITVSPDGRRAYVPTAGSVAIIDTATNKVLAAVAVGSGPQAPAVTPDSNRVYVSNFNDNTVSVIDAGTRKVIATIPVGKSPGPVGIIPDFPFRFFSSKLFIDRDSRFVLLSNITLGDGARPLHPPTEALSVQVGSFAATMGPGSFHKGSVPGEWRFDGTVKSVPIHARIFLTGTEQYLVLVEAKTALPGAKVRLTPSNNSGTAEVTAAIFK